MTAFDPERLRETLARLDRGAQAWALRGSAERARLAGQVARCVAAEAAVWTETAVAIKAAAPDGPQAISADLRRTLAAEEMATGPLATLRLLLLTARSPSLQQPASAAEQPRWPAAHPVLPP